MTLRAVVLISGGLDSTTCLALAKARGFECYTLSFDYGQRHRAELDAAARIAKHFGAVRHEVIKLDVGKFGGSALTDPSIAVPKYSASDVIPVTYVPARNTTFLSIALGYAEVVEAQYIFIGVSAVDYSNYPDCRPEYIAAFQTLANLATRAGIEGRPIYLETPLLYLSKAETIALGQSLGVDYAMTVSCYQATADGQACGTCDSCTLRQRGFNEAAVTDPTLYQGKTHESCRHSNDLNPRGET